MFEYHKCIHIFQWFYVKFCVEFVVDLGRFEIFCALNVKFKFKLIWSLGGY